MPDIHAKLCSPSGAEGWFACAGRVVMEAAFPDKDSEYSADGTARHEICATVLRSPHYTVAQMVGLQVGKGPTYRAEWVDEDQDYVDTVRKLAEGGELFVERVVNFEAHTQVAGDSFGTADAIILKPLADATHELIVIDRKTGYHEVPVERNKQLQLYALGAFDEFAMAYDISRVRLIIHQRAAREWDCSTADLMAFAQEARSRAITVVNAVAMHGQVDQAEWERTFLNQQPTEDACRYCKAMAVCPSMQRTVQETIGASFDDLTSADEETATAAVMEVMTGHTDASLVKAMELAGFLEDFVKAVRAEVERRLLAGTEVPGFKLVLGKAGNRAWTDAEAAEAQLKAMRLKVEEMFDLKLISPTSAEKLAKAKVIGPRQWPKLQSLIGRADPKPSVAPVTDKRDAYVPTPVADDFQPVGEPADDLC